MRSKVLIGALVVAGCLLSGQALVAHHGGSAYDRENPMTVKATITAVSWRNPHVYVQFDAKNADGGIRSWSCESINPGMLEKQGWTRRTLSPGDVVTIVFAPSRTGSSVCLLTSVILADGTEMTTRLLD